MKSVFWLKHLGWGQREDRGAPYRDRGSLKRQTPRKRAGAGWGVGEQTLNQAVHVLSHPSGDAGKTAVLKVTCSRERSRWDAR